MTARREKIASAMGASRTLPLLSVRPLWNGLVVLNYHRIGDDASTRFNRDVFSGTTEQLDRQIRIVRNHAEIVSPKDVPALLAPDAPRGRHVLLTFDDGYRDNYELAFPVLKSHGVRASFFLNSGFMDKPRPTWGDALSWMVLSSTKPELPSNRWIPEALPLDPANVTASSRRVVGFYPSLREDPVQTSAFLEEMAELTGSGFPPDELSRDLWMTWDMAREMHAAGMELGGHTVDHPALADVSPKRQAVEITGVRDRLIEEIGEAPASFAYPYGGRHQFSSVTQDLLARNGYTHAFSFYGGHNRPGRTELFDIRRIYMAQDTSDDAVRGLVTFPQLFGMVPPKLPWKR
jgi:peptidoglycan/xylan/chitin deacetylase (PgdA/CDA1 family)